MCDGDTLNHTGAGEGEEGVSLICCGGLGSERPAVMGAGGWKHVKLIYVCVCNTLNPRLQVNPLQLIAVLYTAMYVIRLSG